VTAAGVYLHLPFCRRICPYCDFAVRTGDRDRRRRFVARLLEEIALADGAGLQFDTIYFGGGTPSLVEPDDLARIVEALRAKLVVASDARLFFEANPEDVTAESVKAWRGLGVETLSLGVQSLDAAALQFLGREHDPRSARHAVVIALEAGFPTVSIDLIYGLPAQDATAWRRELDAVLGLGVQHLSCYELTIHDGTRFGLLQQRGQLAPPDGDVRAELFRLTHEYLGDHGFPGYEASNFASAKEHRSRHNLKYWHHAPYLGFGPSAHSFREPRRWWNLRTSDEWEQRVAAGEQPIGGSESLDSHALALEALLLGLRTYAGVDLDGIRERWGFDVRSRNAELLGRLSDQGLARIEAERLIPTLNGLAVADSLATLFELQ
jgi:oxygen-independent coproporphyrinogen-3 oxidase